MCVYREKPGRIMMFTPDGETSGGFYSFPYFLCKFEFIKVILAQSRNQGVCGGGGGEILCKRRLKLG